MSAVDAPRIAVVGAGVSGLTAAFRLRRRLGVDAVIDVYDAAEQPGGLLCTRTVGGAAVDVGAEAFIVRRPEARDLVAELGLADRVVAPGGMRPAIWADGGLHPLPSPAMMGIPRGPEPMVGLASDDDLQRMAAEPDRPLTWSPDDDPSVGDLVADRFGPSVVARGVDPMLGGVYSALSSSLGLREAIPALARAFDDGAPSLTAAVGRVLDAGAVATGPVFGALRGGYRELVDALVAAGGANLHLGTPVIDLEGGPGRYTLLLDSSVGPKPVDYDAVILAVPIWMAARLLGTVAPEAAAVFETVEPAGSAVVAVAVPASTPLPEHSGVLVATDADLHLKAITLSSQKWPHLRDGDVHTLRTSFGRLGDSVTASDDELVTLASEDLATVFAAAGVPAPVVEDAVVQRWPGGIPHYGPGHLARVRAALALLPAGVGVAGSGYNGVGVPACIGTAGAAVGKVTATLTT
ncbi:protoporphyrinogen oxidase [Gordonia phthalatica]|uniref:Coproporphyrinogen III oxidase n=1 Tax=Gordonia phthalatica TaxID=1136941 RepID=A0A0N9N232_9ACTN|nr:protoporphyrinogen oxidase [Gordonia phthalatica]ALG84675.1 protoporphyrinogen oxidase [Gordonia phthalatica]